MKNFCATQRWRKLLLTVGLLLAAPAVFAQYYYGQWTANLVAGDNTFTISSGTTHSNWTSGVQAITAELLANSVTVNSGTTNVTVTVKKVSTTQFIVNSSAAISGARVTAQYPGEVVACALPTLISVTRSGSTATYTWNNNGSPFTTIILQYSTDGGTTWTGNAGSPVSPRTYSSVPTTTPIMYRVAGYGGGCSESFSNIITVTSGSSYYQTGSQSVGNFYSNPTTLGCGSICVTFSTTNLSVWTTVPTANITTGTQLYIKPSGFTDPIVANSSNCAAYGASVGTTCNKIETGIRWFRLPGSNTVWNVNPSTGVITGVYSTTICN